MVYVHILRSACTYSHYMSSALSVFFVAGETHDAHPGEVNPICICVYVDKRVYVCVCVYSVCIYAEIMKACTLYLQLKRTMPIQVKFAAKGLTLPCVCVCVLLCVCACACRAYMYIWLARG